MDDKEKAFPKTLEEILKTVIGLAMVPDGSAEFAQWHNEELAEMQFYDYIHKLSNLPYSESEMGARLRIARVFIRDNMTAALISPSPYVRKLAELISKDDDREWLQKTYEVYHEKKMGEDSILGKYLSGKKLV